MAFWKLESILRTNCLFLTSIQNLTDKKEGSLTKPTMDILRQIDEDYRQKYSQNGISDDKSQSGWLGFFEKARHSTYLNCWHLYKEESPSMWKDYTKSHDGVAIKSTVKRLITSLKGAREAIVLARVRYIDHEKYDIRPCHPTDPFFLKGENFKDEKELRIVHSGDLQGYKNMDAKFIPVDKNELIEEVVIHPDAPESLHALVKHFADDCNLNAIVRKSKVRLSKNYEKMSGFNCPSGHYHVP